MMKDVSVKDARKKGKGVFALRNFKRGEFIFQSRRGKIITKKDSSKISRGDSKHLNEINKNKWEVMRSPGRYVNHSCDPNTIAHNTKLYALKDIKKEDEITVEYRVNAFDRNRWRCYCGSKNCQKYIISDFFNMSGGQQKFYLPYTLKFIKEKYKNYTPTKKIK